MEEVHQRASVGFVYNYIPVASAQYFGIGASIRNPLRMGRANTSAKKGVTISAEGRICQTLVIIMPSILTNHDSVSLNQGSSAEIYGRPLMF